MKQSVLICNKWYIRFAFKLPNERKLRKKLENIRKSQNFIELLPSAKCFSKSENFVSTDKNLLKNINQTCPVVHYLTGKLEVVSNIL